MTHLSPSEFVDLAEGVLDPSRASHAESCKACRAQAQALRDVLQHARTAEAADPSPLFWDHFQHRVRQAIEAAPAPRRSWFVVRPVSALAATLVVCIGLTFIALYPRPAQKRSTPPTQIPAASITMGPAGDASDDAAWLLLRDVAADMAIEDAHAAGMTIGPAASENALLELTPAERSELGRLLRNALKQTGA